MKRRRVVMMWIAMAAGSGFAQTNTLDYWAATEVVMGMVNANTAAEIARSPNLAAQYQNVLMEQDLAQQAAQRGLAERLDVQRMLQIARRQVLVQALREDIARAIPPITEDEARAAYKKDTARWVKPAAFKLDVFAFKPDDTVAAASAQTLVTGNAVADEDLKKLVNARQTVAQTGNQWLTTNNVSAAIWTSLSEMSLNEVRVFPDGAQTLVIRRGPYSGDKQLTFEEAREYVSRELFAERAAAAWRDYVTKRRKALGL